MLDSETRRRIDTARDILVGKVPDPKSQVEQITIALVYKFMDDMDMQSVEIGGKRSFFKGKFEKYSWSNIFDPRLGGVEMLALYGEAITNMSQNENLPQLFRDIFKNAFLPYRDPETLKLFLKTINEFTYDHSEKLGDAFEYLLSVLGSQGDAGQFRTPRHIIDFMVQVVAPQKHETVLDPACGTAGFLISAYKYILNNSTPSALSGTSPKSANERNKISEVSQADLGEAGRGSGLTIQEKQRVYENFIGYDISPDMVRLSLVNLYLHGFVKPQIHEYDTLTSDERWNEYADVILANPPFMSPKGGIQPHKRFSVQSSRSEVLFVDYMAEHLTPNGRAAIIVPEGIIFQSGTAYKQLRKFLIEQNYLWAVVSLPAGVFNPYAGVKTSILFLDKALAKKTDQVLFVKVTADGFDLGAQRRPIDRNDLPDALHILNAWKQTVASGAQQSAFADVVARSRWSSSSEQSEERIETEATKQSPGKEEIASLQDASQSVVAQSASPSQRHGSNDMYLLVPSSRLAENGDYNLSADRYRAVTRVGKQTYPMVNLEDVCEINPETAIPSEIFGKTEFTYIDISSVENGSGKIDYTNKVSTKEAPSRARRLIKENDVLLSTVRPNLKAFAFVKNLPEKSIASTGFAVLRASERILPEYLFAIIFDDKTVSQMIQQMGKGAYPSINQTDVASLQIPLPPLENQRQIVDEIAAHQRVIDGARQVVEGWKPNIEVELDEMLPEGIDEWPYVKLDEICDSFKNGANFSSEQVGTGVKFVNIKDVFAGRFVDVEPLDRIDITDKEIEKVKLKDGDIVFIRSSVKYEGVGYPALIKTNGETIVFCGFIIKCSPKPDLILPEYLLDTLHTEAMRAKVISLSNRANITNISQDSLKSLEIPLPPLEVQREVVARIERERAIVEGNRELIKIYEEKIKKVIERVWEA